MADVVIENPIINSPFEEPSLHFKFEDEGITNVIIESRRVSSYFSPIAQPRRKKGQLQFDTEWTKDRIEENKQVNRIRQRVSLWRQGGYAGVTPVTARLLEYWTNPDRERKLFFCQIEALETAIYITEVAKKYGDAWIENALQEANEMANPGLPRIAFKMATGTGKTVVMAMLIAWHTLNKIANPQDARFTDTFLIITPGITIRDRLRVLLPNDPENYYRLRDVLSNEQIQELGRAKIYIVNRHVFQLREKSNAASLTKVILGKGNKNVFKETPDQMVRRACRDLGSKKNIMIINDEAHHCYRHKPDGIDDKLTGDDRIEAQKREEGARVWISGIEAIKRKIGIKQIYDLSATPFFLRGSGYSEGTLFPWVVSDFALIDAIESGIVKVPRVPVADDSVTGDQPTYRNLWVRIREELPRRGRKTQTIEGEPKIPAALEGAIRSLYNNYKLNHDRWEKSHEARERGQTPPVFIVVCNNTNVSNLVFRYISGWEKTLKNGKKVLVPGKLPILDNTINGEWRFQPNTILVDSEQLESGEALSAEFKAYAAIAIERFKAEYKIRFPGREVEKLTDADLLREVMNTVGKAGKLGENIKCVVSVSMLTEGWDATTVTHILGVRAFGTQLLCEQVVGRALRRVSFATNEKGMFNPEYAEVYGVPFSFIPCSGATKEPTPGPLPTRVRALEERITCEITFPKLIGYRYDVPGEKLPFIFDENSKLSLTTADVPTITENAPIIGEISIHDLNDLKDIRLNEVAFLLADLTLKQYFIDDEGNTKPWLFPQLLKIAKEWLDNCIICKDNTFPQLLVFQERAYDAADRIYKSIVEASQGTPTLKPILKPYDSTGSTRYVDFDTTKPVYTTKPDKCHISHVVADTESWEQKMAQSLENMDEVIYYVKNHNLGFNIPYTINGEEKQYIPDFIVHIDDGNGDKNILNLIIEVTGERKKAKAAKVSTAKTLWVPSVNNHGGFGRWAFIEIADPWDAKNIIRSKFKL